MPDHSFSKEIFPNTQSKPSLTQLEAISSRASKELERHQLQSGACAPPPYMCPFDLFMHFSFPLLSPLGPPLSLQDSPSPLPPGPGAGSCCLPLPGMAGLGQGPQAPQPHCPNFWGGGKLGSQSAMQILHRESFPGKDGLISSLNSFLSLAGKIRESPLL